MALRRTDRDLSALSVLGLLFHEPRYTFEIYRMALEMQMNFLSGVPRALYHAVERLARDDLVRAVGNERAGLRPERTIYAITPAGRVDLMRRVRSLLEHPEPDAGFFAAALSFLDCLPASEVLAAIERRHDELERLLTDRRCKLDSSSELLRIRLNYEVTRLDTERHWVAQLIGKLRQGVLQQRSWISDISKTAEKGRKDGESNHPEQDSS
jgi:DNA-binding PadR family transcriptional regulator